RDGRRIVTGKEGGTAKVWDAASLLHIAQAQPDGIRAVAARSQELLILEGHTGRITSVAFSPDGRRIATGSYDGTAKVWEAPSGRELLTRIKGLRKLWQWDWVRGPGHGRELLTLNGHNLGVSSVAYSPDGQRIVTGSHDGTAKVWDAASGRELLTLNGHKGAVSCVAFSPDGQRIVTGSYDRTAKVWEAASKEQVAQWQAEEAAAGQR
ncbi:MAG TPA: WD40 repeat domain-containing protein, partial [Candidatus Saccharimonadales bacterium]|nr:WD40 repeat domain-containing protein [Candidatus Saccharimonadales bacterium]